MAPHNIYAARSTDESIAAMLASGFDAMTAAAAGVWLHCAAARRLGAAFIADDLAYALTTARAAL